MEQIDIPSFDNLLLPAQLHPGKRGMVVFAHGFLGDKSSKGRFDRAIEELGERNIRALAFDFGGCGASGDRAVSIEGMVKDLHAVLDWVEARDFAQSPCGATASAHAPAWKRGVLRSLQWCLRAP